MATSGDERESPAAGNVVLKTGYLHKRGGSYRSWKRRYFVLSNVDLKYFKREGASTPKNVIDLKQGRGVRNQHLCGLEWPNDAKPGLSFGLATEKRTYYLYGNDKAIVKDWMSMLQQCINKIGKPSDDYKNDPEGKPESAFSKAVRGGAKLAARVTKFVTGESGVVHEDMANATEGVADSTQNQAEADRDTTVSERLKVPGGDAAGIVGDSEDNEIVGTTTSVAQEQLEADKDVSLQQRVPMAMVTTSERTSEVVDCEIAPGNLTSTDVARDQAEDDEEMSTKQRVGGSVVGGASEMVDNEILSRTINVTGGGITDQDDANEDVSLKERTVMAVGSDAGGAKGLDTITYNSEGKATCSAIESTAEKAQEKKENEKGSPR